MSCALEAFGEVQHVRVPTAVTCRYEHGNRTSDPYLYISLRLSPCDKRDTPKNKRVLNGRLSSEHNIAADNHGVPLRARPSVRA